MNAIDPSKTYRTADGKSVRILATDLPGPWPVAIIVSGDSLVTQLTTRGCKAIRVDETPFIIEEKPRIKEERWINVYRTPPNNGDSTYLLSFHKSPTAANSTVNSSRIACVKITIDCEEGTGL